MKVYLLGAGLLCAAAPVAWGMRVTRLAALEGGESEAARQQLSPRMLNTGGVREIIKTRLEVYCIIRFIYSQHVFFNIPLFFTS